MNEKLKFNIERLKRDFEDVIDELCREISETEERYIDYYSPAYVEDLQDDLQELEKKVEELEEQLKQYKNE